MVTPKLSERGELFVQRAYRFRKVRPDRTLPDEVPEIIGVQMHGGNRGAIDEASRSGGFPGAGWTGQDEDGSREVGHHHARC